MSETYSTSYPALNQGQAQALQILQGSDNVFLTGAAGSGKSFLINSFLKGKDIPVLASTGTAAILVGGCTFHSFFGLGIMEGGFDKTVQKALKDRNLVRRLNKTKTVVIDEISMISSMTLQAAETISRMVRKSESPWGGIRIIVVGDFAQLPPVSIGFHEKLWAFQSTTWAMSHFHPVVLTEIMRSTDSEYLHILNRVRQGLVDNKVIHFLQEKQNSFKKNYLQLEMTTRLFSHRDHVEKYNLRQLEKIKHELFEFKTQYFGASLDVQKFKKLAPIPENIVLKKEALVMLRQNDVHKRWVNGSVGVIKKIQENELRIELQSGENISVEKTEFKLLNADGTPLVVAINFPINLAWAMTIHKAQGVTLDQLTVSLAHVWEPGQAYVALSRARNSQGVFVEDWNTKSIKADPKVMSYYRGLMHQNAEL
ncbi:MAG: AAA family ATPase [Bdellovibrionales bacterium]|nr:AAA family ATPase [Bdellovibrionales bacterium]